MNIRSSQEQSLALTLQAHAKINPILRVLDRTRDGFHEIETLFQRLALADAVSVRVTDSDSSLSVRWEGIRPGDLGPVERNLAWRAADAFRARSGWPTGWHIEITKRIPVGAGLGGGSSDAAAVLRALNTLALRPFDEPQLIAMGAALGADVAFFVAGFSRAIGRGRGEALSPLEPLPPASVRLVVPGFPISTAEAYAELDIARDRDGERAPARLFDDDPGFEAWADVIARSVNDFEGSTYRRYPELDGCRRRLTQAGAAIAMLSGSGSTVFGLWQPGDEPPAEIAIPPLARLLKTTTL